MPTKLFSTGAAVRAVVILVAAVVAAGCSSSDGAAFRARILSRGSSVTVHRDSVDAVTDRLERALASPGILPGNGALRWTPRDRHAFVRRSIIGPTYDVYRYDDGDSVRFDVYGANWPDTTNTLHAAAFAEYLRTGTTHPSVPIEIPQ